MKRDVIIIGGGAAGLSAGFWCAELGLSALVLEKSAEPGGQLLWTFNPVRNHLGIAAENGKDLRDRIIDQVENSSVDIKTGADVREVDLGNKSIHLTDGSTLDAAALIIATGIRRRKLNVKGEEEFAGKGILASGVRDGELARDKDVCILGGGDSAFENALLLADVARSVTLIHRSDRFRARREFIEKAENDSRINIMTSATVAEIEGGEQIEAIRVLDTVAGQTFMLPAQALLVRIGVEPNAELFQGTLDLDDKGFIVVNAKCETSVENVYAIGDIASPYSMTVSTAVGMGATAANVIAQKMR